MFGRGGVLAAVRRRRRELLPSPAYDFVAEFIGADRGYRGLQFRHATGLPLHEIRSVSEPEIDALSLDPGDWALVEKPDGSPYAWIKADGVTMHRDGNHCTTAPLRADRFSVPTIRCARRSTRRYRRRRVRVLRWTVTVSRSAVCSPMSVLAALKKQAARDSMRYLSHLDDAWALTIIHLRLSLIPIVLGLMIAVPLGALIQRTTAAAAVDHHHGQHHLHDSVAGAIRGASPDHPDAILDEANVIVALTLYTTALLVRAVPEALDAVPAPVRDAATAVGYRPLTRMLKVELPLSIPVLVASLRVVAVTNISMVAVGSVIGIGGLGTWFTEGYQSNKSDQIIAGIIAIFVLAIVIDTLIMLAGRPATPWTRVAGGGRVARPKAKAAA